MLDSAFLGVKQRSVQNIMVKYEYFKQFSSERFNFFKESVLDLAIDYD